MLWYELVIYFFTVLISEVFLIFIFAKLTDNKIKQYINTRNLIIVIILSLIATINSIYNNTLSKNLIQILIIYFINAFLFKLNTKKTILYTLFTYLIMLIIEFVLSLSFVIISVDSAKNFGEHIYLKTLFSLVVMILTYIVSSISFVKKICFKIYNTLGKASEQLILCISIILIVLFSLITFSRAINSSSLSALLFNTLPLVITFIIIILLIVEKYKLKKSMKEQETLMNFINEYEKIIDDDRIKRHELLNNLLVLKSFKNKNSKEYTETIDKFIESYETKGLKRTRNIYNLPSGLKGIVFYKLHDIEKLNINIVSNISTPSVAAFDKLDSKTYVKVCKIIGILLDNAIEAAKSSKDKEIVLELYKQKGQIVFYLENSYKGKIDLSKINKNNYSTKGKNRGYGLFLVNKIVNKTNSLFIEQNVNNRRFSTIVKIKI